MSTFRFALRTFAKAPGFASVAVLTLALGIGANAAIFSVVDAVLLRPLPYPDSDRIVLLSADLPQAYIQFRTDVGFRVFPEQLSESRAFATIGIAESGGLNLGEERPERVNAGSVTPEFFDVLDIPPLLGRVPTREDFLGKRSIAVLGHALWQRRFDEDPEVLGRTIRLNGRPAVVVGVMPPHVEFPERAEVWVPASLHFRVEGPASKPAVVARLAPGTSLSRASDELVRILHESGWDGLPEPRLTLLREELVGHIRPLLSAIGWGAVFVLLVACINVANLLFTRLAAREQELIVRRVLGASRRQLAVQALVESLVLAVAAGAAALPVALWTLEGMRFFVPPTLHGANDIAMNARAVAALAGISLLTAVLVGLLPSVFLSERISSYTRGAFGATVGPLQQRVRSVLVVAEVAMALILLASAVTIMDTLARLMGTNIGARGDGALVVELTVPRSRGASSTWPVYERLVAELRAVPGIDSVGLTDELPGAAPKLLDSRPVNVIGAPLRDQRRAAIASCATPEYFEALGVDLVAGRTFTATDRPGSPRVAVVSEGFAETLGVRPWELVGRHTNAAGMMRPAESREIVGVVRDVRFWGPESMLTSSIYFPCSEQPPYSSAQIVVKSEIAVETLTPLVRRAAARVAPQLPLYNVRIFEEIRAAYLTDRRLAMTVLLAFGGIAFVLAIVGLYGVMSYLVELRTGEIGIRLVFGASSSRVKGDFLAYGLLHAAGGAAVGAVFTVGLSQLAWAHVAGMERVDPWNLVGLVLAVTAVAAFASWLPARRATRIDPVHTLRFE